MSLAQPFATRLFGYAKVLKKVDTNVIAQCFLTSVVTLTLVSGLYVIDFQWLAKKLQNTP